MLNEILQAKPQLELLCRKYHVKRLELFGSAATAEFDPRRSDLDFIVEFDPARSADLFHQYFGLNEALEQLFERKVDLVMAGAMTNQHFIKSADKTRQSVYAG